MQMDDGRTRNNDLNTRPGSSPSELRTPKKYNIFEFHHLEKINFSDTPSHGSTGSSKIVKRQIIQAPRNLTLKRRIAHMWKHLRIALIDWDTAECEAPQGREFWQQTRPDIFQFIFYLPVQESDLRADGMRDPQPGQQAIEVPQLFSPGRSLVGARGRENGEIPEVVKFDGLKSRNDPPKVQRGRVQTKLQLL